MVHPDSREIVRMFFSYRPLGTRNRGSRLADCEGGFLGNPFPVEKI